MAEDAVTQGDKDGGKKPRAKQVPEWRRYGDPRNTAGHFRPKKNLKSLYGRGKKWTRESLAKAMGLKDPTLISKWATGARYMSDEEVVRCSIATSVSVSWLLDVTDLPYSQGWSQAILNARPNILNKIKGFSDGKTWAALARDYQEASRMAREFSEEFEANCLKLSGARNMREYELWKTSDEIADIFTELEEDAYEMTSREPWAFEVDDDPYEPHMEELDSSELERYVNEIEKAYPGDYREPVHLAHAMLDAVMRAYPQKGLEELTGLLNQASRMTQRL